MLIFLLIFQKGKGIARSVMRGFTFESYVEALLGEKQVVSENVQFTKDNYLIHMTRINKRTLNAFDNKRQLASCGIHSWSYGDSCTPQGLKCDCGGLG